MKQSRRMPVPYLTPKRPKEFTPVAARSDDIAVPQVQDRVQAQTILHLAQNNEALQNNARSSPFNQAQCFGNT